MGCSELDAGMPPVFLGRNWPALLAVLALTVIALAVAASPSRALAASGINWGHGAAATLPANAASPSTVEIQAVSCAAPGDCSAVGGYYDSFNHWQGLLLDERSGTWALGIEATLPANAGSNPDAGVDSVSCTASGDCTAVGTYVDTANHNEGLLLTESSGVWSRGVEASLPANAGADPGAGIGPVSCWSPGNCAAIGGYRDVSDNTQALLLSESNGTWGTASEATLPSGAASAATPELESLSCSAAGDCTAVGQYIDSADEYQLVLLTETSGVWGAGVKGALPANAGSYAHPSVSQVSCASPGTCTAVGIYIDSSGNTDALLLDQNGGTWQTGIEPTLPADAGPSSQSVLVGVSCPAAGHCTAVGGYFDASGNQRAMMVNQSGSTWGTGVAATLPADAGATPYPSVNSVSCASAGNCAAVGSYDDTSGTQRGMLISESGGDWSSGIEPTAPSDAANGVTTPTVISCGGLDSCAVAGYYNSTSGASRVLLLDGYPGAPSVSASAPLSGVPGTQIAPSAISATVSGGSDPTGQVTYRVFGPQSSPPAACSSGGTVVGTASVSGNGTYNPSAGFTPSVAGDYWWYAGYGGDASNGPAGSVCGASMPETTVVTAKPIDINPPAISGEATVGQTLTESHGTWGNTPSWFTYQWLLCNHGGNSCLPIAGATGQTYTVVASEVKQKLRVVETASNAVGAASATSTATAVITSPPAAVIYRASARGREVRVALRCVGKTGAACRAKLTLTAGADRETIVGTRRVGAAGRTFRVGTRKTVLVALNRRGRALLARDGRIALHLNVVQDGSLTKSRRVTLWG